MSQQQSRSSRAAEQVQTIALSSIDLSPKPWRPCNFQRQSRWPEFVDSVREHGLMIEPKCRLSAEGAYEPITGLRALLAAREAGASDVKCVVAELDDISATIAAFHAQLAESEPASLVMEKAWAIQNLQQQLLSRGEPASCRAIASMIGKSKSLVNYSIAIANALPRDCFLAIAAEEGIPESIAIALPKTTAVRIAKGPVGERYDLVRPALRALNAASRNRVIGAGEGRIASTGYLNAWQKTIMAVRRFFERVFNAVARLTVHRPRAAVHCVDKSG